MHFLVTTHLKSGDYINCVVWANSIYRAEKKAVLFWADEGEDVHYAEAELFDTFEHGDITDYEIIE